MAGNQLAVGIYLRLGIEQFVAGAAQASAQYKASIASMGAATRTLSDEVNGALAQLGIRSFDTIKAEIAAVVANYDRLAKSGQLSSQELERAAQAAATKLSALNREMGIENAQVGADRLNRVAVAATASTGAVERFGAGVAANVQGLIAMGAALLGVGQGLEAVRASVQAAATLDRITTALNTVSGGAQNGAASLAFVRVEAQRLGLDLQTAARDFTALTAATNGTALAGERTRDIFTAVSQAATVLGLSTEQTSGALTAIQQMVSKGTVAAEELRGQLGERLPGAFQIAARAIGVTTAELQNLLETGSLAADQFLPKFAAQLQREFAGGVTAAAGSVRAELQRLQSTIFELQASFGKALNESGLGEAVRVLQAKLADPAVQASLSRLAKLLGDVAAAAVTMSDRLLSVGQVLAVVIPVTAIIAGMARISAALDSVAVSSRAVQVAAAGAGQSLLTTSTTQVATATGLFGKLSGALMLLTRAAWVITLAVEGIPLLKSAADATVEFALRRKTLTEFDRQYLAQQFAVKDSLEAATRAQGQYAGVQLQSVDAIAKLTAEQAQQYRAELLGRRELAAARVAEAGNLVRINEALLRQAEARGNDAIEVARLKRAIEESSAVQRDESAKIREVETALRSVSDAYKVATGALSRDTIPAVQKLTAAFDQQLKTSPVVEEALKKVFEGFQANSVTSVEAVIRTLVKLEREGKINAAQLRKAMDGALDGLGADELAAFGINVRTAFGDAEKDSAQLAAGLDADARRALKALGVDAEAAKQGVSRAFLDMIQSFETLVSAGVTAGPQFRAALGNLVDGAKTQAEVQRIITVLNTMRAAGVLSAEEIAGAMARLNTRLAEATARTLELAKAQTALAQARLGISEAQNGLLVQESKLTSAILDYEATRTKYAKDNSEQADRQIGAAAAAVKLEEAKVTQQEKQVELAKVQASLQDAQNKLKNAEAALQKDSLNPELQAAVERAKAVVQAQEVGVERSSQALIAAKATTSEYDAQLTIARELISQTEKRAAAEGKVTAEVEKQAKAKQDAEDAEKRRQAGATTQLFNESDSIETKIAKVQKALSDLGRGYQAVGLGPAITAIADQYRAVLARLYDEQRASQQKTFQQAQQGSSQVMRVVTTTAQQTTQVIQSIGDVTVNAPNLSPVSTAIDRVRAQALQTSQIIASLSNPGGLGPGAVGTAATGLLENGLSFDRGSTVRNAVEGATQAARGVVTLSGTVAGSIGGSSAGATVINNYNNFDAKDLLSEEQVRRKIIPALDQIAKRSR